MIKIPSVLLLAASLLLAGCLVPRNPHPYRHHPGHQPPPGPEVKPREPEPAPPEEKEVPEHGAPSAVRTSAPESSDEQPAPAPSLSIRVEPASARRGQEVELHLDPPTGPNVTVFWNNQPLPKQTLNNAVLKVRIPGDATSGRFHVEWKGKRFPSPMVDLK